MTMQPAATARGTYSRDAAAPAENSARCAALKSNSASGSSDTDRPRKVTDSPSERSAASAWSLATGKLRSSRICTIASPTRPLAPTTATLNSAGALTGGRGTCCVLLLGSPLAPGDVGRSNPHVRILRPLPQVMIHQYEGQHGLGNRRRAQAHTRVMTSGRDDLNRPALHIDR